jgi:hypothetical protein
MPHITQWEFLHLINFRLILFLSLTYVQPERHLIGALLCTRRRRAFFAPSLPAQILSGSYQTEAPQLSLPVPSPLQSPRLLELQPSASTSVANMAPFAICSELILVIHANPSNKTNYFI